MIETAEKEEKEIDDALSLTEEERSLSSGIFNILGTLVKGEPLQTLHTSGFSGFEAWRYSPTTPMRGMQFMMAATNPGKAKGLEEVAIHIDRWEAKVLALSRDFNQLLSEKMRALSSLSLLSSSLSPLSLSLFQSLFLSLWNFDNTSEQIFVLDFEPKLDPSQSHRSSATKR